MATFVRNDMGMTWGRFVRQGMTWGRFVRHAGC